MCWDSSRNPKICNSPFLCFTSGFQFSTLWFIFFYFSSGLQFCTLIILSYLQFQSRVAILWFIFYYQFDSRVAILTFWLYTFILCYDSLDINWHSFICIDTQCSVLRNHIFYIKLRNTLKAQTLCWDSDLGDFDFRFLFMFIFNVFLHMFFILLLAGCNLWTKKTINSECKKSKSLKHSKIKTSQSNHHKRNWIHSWRLLNNDTSWILDFWFSITFVFFMDNVDSRKLQKQKNIDFKFISQPNHVGCDDLFLRRVQD